MSGAHDVPAVRQREIDVVEPDRIATGGRDARRPGAGERLRFVDRHVERVQPIDHRFKAGKVHVIVDEEGQRVGDLPERARGLRHRSELNLAGEIEWRSEDERDDGRNLTEELGKCPHPHAPVDHVEIIGDQRRETSAEQIFLRGLAVQQRDLLGVFAQPSEREAVVGFHVLALKIEFDQRPPDQMRN